MEGKTGLTFSDRPLPTSRDLASSQPEVEASTARRVEEIKTRWLELDRALGTELEGEAV